MTNEQPIRIEIRSKKKYRGKTEYHEVQVVECLEFGLYKEGQWSLTAVLRSLAEQNPRITRPCHVFRGDTPCFQPFTLNQWFFDRRPEQLKRGD